MTRPNPSKDYQIDYIDMKTHYKYYIINEYLLTGWTGEVIRLHIWFGFRNESDENKLLRRI